jgi:hypothetical protein
MEVDRFIGFAELCQILDVKHTKLCNMFKSGELTKVKNGAKSGALGSEVNLSPKTTRARRERQAMTTNHNLDAALRLAAAGLAVFPCNPNPRPHPKSKHPLVNWKTQATTGIGVEFTGRYAGAVPGIHLGKAGLIVVDLDVGHAEGQDGVTEFDSILDHYGGSLDSVPVVKTASGGYHLYFRQPTGREPLGNREGMLAGCGINIRGAGGYVIAAGAVMSDGTYYECVAGWPDLCEAFAAGTIPEIPGWLVDLIDRQPVRPEGGPSSQSNPGVDNPARYRAWAVSNSGKWPWRTEGRGVTRLYVDRLWRVAQVGPQSNGGQYRGVQK